MKFTAMHTSMITPGLSRNLVDRSRLSVNNQVILPGLPQLQDADLEGDVMIIPDRFPVVPTRRLVVLVPDGEIDESSLTRRIWQLAVSSNLNILYLGLASQETYVAYQRSRLASLASMTSGKEVRAQMSVSTEKSWLKALEKTWRPGDLLVCLESHKIPSAVVWRTPLGELLARSASVPVYLIGGLKIGLAPRQRQWIKEMLVWSAALLLLTAFFGLQVLLDRSSAKPLSTILICLSVFVELYFLWKINEWIG
jgi:hypothetical protein